MISCVRPKVLLHDHLDGGVRPADGGRAGRGARLPGPPHDRRGRALAAGSTTPRTPARWSATWRPSRTPWASCRPRRRWPGWPRSAPRTSRPTAWSTRRSATPPSCTWPRAWSCRPSSRRSTRGSARGRSWPRQPVRRSGSARCSPRCGTPPARWRSPSWRCATATTGWSGFDIAGAEAGFPPTRHLDAFEYLQRENAHFTIHAGEGFGLPSIWQAIQWCGADRLGHGVRIIDDITVGSDGEATAGPARGLRAGQADPAGDGADLERHDRRGAVHRGAPDRAAAPAAASGSPSTPTTG